MKPLIYNLINGRISENSSDTYAVINAFSSYPRVSSTQGKDIIQVLVNNCPYTTTELKAYGYNDDPKACKFIIYYTNQNRVFINYAPSSDRITFQANKTYIYEPIKQESNSLSQDQLFPESDWVKAGKYIDFETKEIVGWHYDYYGEYN